MAHCFKTKGGIEIDCSRVEVSIDTALDEVYRAIDTRKGAIFSSGFDYPGRHSRWDIGFIDPAIEISSSGRSFTISALNDRGAAILPLVSSSLKANMQLKDIVETTSVVSGAITEPSGLFSEEQRSKQPSIFSVIRSVSNLFSHSSVEGSHLGLYGAFGYDLVLQFETINTRLDRSAINKDLHLYLPLELIVVDRKREAASKISYSVQTPAGSTSSMNGGGRSSALSHGSGDSTVVSDHLPGQFADKVRKVIDGTKRGDYFEVVLSQSFETRFDGSPTDLFRRLAQINPSPYMFLLNFGDEQLVGASPEIFIRVTGTRYETCPIAGTIRRGGSALEDADHALELLASKKDESELTMCTDVDRNDMARVCVPGSVKVLGRRQLEFYSHLIHTVDHLEGTLRDEFDSLDAFQTKMWACTVTGAPKPAAMQEIENLESSPRGWYSGAVGFISFDGNINTGITLRTASLRSGRATIRSGATLLFGSDPDMEERETRTKAAAFLAALAGSGAPKAPAAEAAAAPAKNIFNAGHRPKVLLVDYRDSFVHNLAAYLEELGAAVTTMRFGFPESLLDEIRPNLVLLSPGPGSPEEFGVPDMVGTAVRHGLPVFGVCLGHQGIGQHFGAKLGQLEIPVHGKPSVVEHTSAPLFEKIERQFEAGRYHSLYIKEETLPSCLEVTARTINDELNGGKGVIMAIQHRTLPVASVQFHPESLMTLKQRTGHQLLTNALRSLIRAA